MKILLIAIGTRGDVQPFLTLGRALVARGHRVSLAAPQGFTAEAEAAGLDAHPLPMDFQELLQKPEMQGALTSLSGKLKAYRWATDLMNQQLTAIWELGLALEPQLLLHHFKGSLAPWLAERLGIASIPVMLQPGFTPTGDYPQFLIAARSLGRWLNRASYALILPLMRWGTTSMIRRWTRATGIDPGPKRDPLAGHDPRGAARRLHAYSPTLFPRDPAWPEAETQTGYLFAEPPDWSPPADLTAFLEAGDPPIYVGFGSMPGIDHARTTRAVLGALERTGRRAVIATGWGGIADLDPSPNFHVLSSVPHAWLFPRVAAVVHHGGSGTTHEGLRWGRPSIVCPLFADQPMFGQRVFELGAGPRPVRQKALTADRLAEAIEVALRPEVAARAADLGEQIREEDGLGGTIALVERYA
ncbi:MAG: glycosyltransferase family 1 protein [Myxococcales bacterium]|nr:glycosyltransferase family 1 protein [Myxococcales bacterium]